MSKVRLIDADALFAEFENAKWYDNKDRDLVAEDILMAAPEVDAVPVVRCKDCAHGRYDDESEMYECGYVGLALYNEPNYYCSDGVKMESEGNNAR